MVARAFLIALVTIGGAGCAAKAKAPLAVALLLDGDRSAIGVIGPRAVSGLELREVTPPAAPLEPVDDSVTVVTHARSAYAAGDHAQCRDELSRIDVVRLLAAKDRGLASRTLTFTAACAWSAGLKQDAISAAARLASFGLELPDAAVSPDVEAVIARAIADEGKQPRVAVAVTGEAGALLSIDGRPPTCPLPCTTDLGPGDHVLAVEADGFSPASTLIRVPDTTTAAIPQAPAAAALAAEQFRARLARGIPPTDPIAVALIARLSTSPRVAYVYGAKRLGGSMIVDGKLVAEAHAEAGAGAALIRNLAYDGRVLVRPAVWQRPWFWITVSGAALLVATAIVAVTYEPEIRTQVGF